MDTNSIVSQNYAAWRQALPALADELSLLAEDPAQLSDSFYRFLEFGTAGMRGVLGLGTNRMNLYTVRRATAGLARYKRRGRRAAASPSPMIPGKTASCSRAIPRACSRRSASSRFSIPRCTAYRSCPTPS